MSAMIDITQEVAGSCAARLDAIPAASAQDSRQIGMQVLTRVMDLLLHNLAERQVCLNVNSNLKLIGGNVL